MLSCDDNGNPGNQGDREPQTCQPSLVTVTGNFLFWREFIFSPAFLTTQFDERLGSTPIVASRKRSATIVSPAVRPLVCCIHSIPGRQKKQRIKATELEVIQLQIEHDQLFIKHKKLGRRTLNYNDT